MRRYYPFSLNTLFLVLNGSQDFEDWAKVAEIMNSKAHLIKKGLEQIKVIKTGMNRSRDNVSSFLFSY